ncbi:MAG: NAD(P)H-dependent oxidoreductase subunit E [Phycisphaerae bacterium]|nr:NAD(P)H-dependent oxidoreductase subunit E [Phycisphaerae bacterium]
MNLSKVDNIIQDYKGNPSSLVMILQDIQEELNYLPEPVLNHVAGKLSLSVGHVCSVATFYSSFSLEERGKNVIRVCDGTACHLRGANLLKDEIVRALNISEGQTTEDKLFTLEVVACLGACALAPVMTVNKKYYGQVTREKLLATLEKYRQKDSCVLSEPNDSKKTD